MPEPIDEFDIANAIRSGELSSPQHIGNSWLFDLRITGTGQAYRDTLKEYVLRPARYYLTPDFVERCMGLPVILDHPVDGMLDGREYRRRVIGSIVLPYISREEVRGVARIFDDRIAQAIVKHRLSTSPMVVFAPDETLTKELDGDHTLLVEGKPSYLDHLAVCAVGVWDKGLSPHGIRID